MRSFSWGERAKRNTPAASPESRMACTNRRSTPTRPRAAASSSSSALAPGTWPLFVLHDVNRNLHRHVPVQPHGDLEIAQRLDGILQVHFAAVDGVALLLQRDGNVGCRHRTE